MSAEFWAILSVGAAVLSLGVAVLGLGWRIYVRLDARLDTLQIDMSAVKERLARIEGWIAGRFREDVNGVIARFVAEITLSRVWLCEVVG